MTAGDILSEAVYLGSAANANILTAHCTLGQGSNYPDNGFWYIYQSDYDSTNKKQIALAYKTYTIMIRQMVDGVWTDWHSVLTNADIARGYKSGLSVPAGSYIDTTVSHNLNTTPTSALATLRINSIDPNTMKNVQIEVARMAASSIVVRVHNANTAPINADFSWFAVK